MSYLALAQRIIAERGLEAPSQDLHEPAGPRGLGEAPADDPRAVADAPGPPRTWLLASPGPEPGAMRLAVAAEPPWPELVHVAARIAGRIDDLHRAGRDREAEGAAISLEGLLAKLRREGIETWLSS